MEYRFAQVFWKFSLPASQISHCDLAILPSSLYQFAKSSLPNCKVHMPNCQVHIPKPAFPSWQLHISKASCQVHFTLWTA
jgi:hypothetical protein